MTKAGRHCTKLDSSFARSKGTSDVVPVHESYGRERDTETRYCLPLLSVGVRHRGEVSS
jgi:hypothetical protein